MVVKTGKTEKMAQEARATALVLVAMGDISWTCSITHQNLWWYTYFTVHWRFYPTFSDCFRATFFSFVILMNKPHRTDAFQQHFILTISSDELLIELRWEETSKYSLIITTFTPSPSLIATRHSVVFSEYWKRITYSWVSFFSIDQNVDDKTC